MANYSQNQFNSIVGVHLDWLDGLPLDEKLSLVFAADAKGNVTEPLETDNQQSATIRLRGSYDDCQ